MRLVLVHQVAANFLSAEAARFYTVAHLNTMRYDWASLAMLGSRSG